VCWYALKACALGRVLPLSPPLLLRHCYNLKYLKKLELSKEAKMFFRNAKPEVKT